MGNRGSRSMLHHSISSYGRYDRSLPVLCAVELVQVPCDLLSLDTVDQALALRGIGDYAFVAESAGGLLGRVRCCITG